MGNPEKQRVHSVPEVLNEIPERHPQRPLTSAEKLAATTVDVQSASSRSSTSDDAPVVEDADHRSTEDVHGGLQSRESAAHGGGLRGFLARATELERTLDRKLGIESEAISRKDPESRQTPTWHSQLVMFCLWASGTMNLSCFATGFLGYEFGLTLVQSVLVIIFASLLGGAVSGYCATMGAPTGLRQMSVGRFAFGWYPNKVIALLNAIQNLGWSAVGCITGGLALTAVSNGAVSMTVGVMVIAVCGAAISLAGLRAILVYEKYAWIIYFIIFLIIFGQTGSSSSTAAPLETGGLQGATLAGTVLSLFAVVYGSSASWSTMASDYYTHYPVKISRIKVFTFTALGISVPTSIGMCAGAVVASALPSQPVWNDAYENGGIGYLIREMLHPTAFADVILVLLVLSGVNNVIISMYSSSLSLQQFSRPFALIPRLLWTVLCFGIVIALALAGRDDLLAYLQNFLSLLGYWCTAYFAVVLLEHHVFRRGRWENWDLDAFNDPTKLPLGIAAAVAFVMSIVAAVLGMVQTWFTGPIAKQIGESGGDVGNELAIVLATAAYLAIRGWELKRFGR